MNTYANAPPFALPAHNIEAVLAAGGMNGFRHCGVLDELDAQKIPIGIVTGVSVGAIVAAFYTNRFSGSQITEIFLEALKNPKDPISIILSGWRELSRDMVKIMVEDVLSQDPFSYMMGGWMTAVGKTSEAFARYLQKSTSLSGVMDCLTVPDPISGSIGGCIDLIGPMRKMVKRFDLKPNWRLRILGADLFTQTFVVLEGPDIDLAHALTLACSLPKVFRPQWDKFEGGMRLLGDGATIHYSPADFCKDPAIFSTFRPCTEVPPDIDNWLYRFFTECEIHCPLAGNHRFVDSARHLVIETGDPDVSGLNFGLSADRCLKMHADARLVTRAALDRARQEGRLVNLPVV